MPRTLSFALALVAVACTKVESSSIKTSGMSAHVEVSADGTGRTTASASLNVDDSLTDFVDLSPGDSFVVSVNAQSQTMSRSDVLNDISYLATFSGQDAENTAYTVALRRASDTSAPGSTCTIPKPFTIQAPAASATVSRTRDDIVVQYTSAGTTDSMTYDVQGDCVATSTAQPVPGGDSGSFTIAKGTLSGSSGGSSDAGATCPLTITVHRSRTGHLDPAYGHGGRVWAEQVRSVTVSSTP
jgi:hypothetical protein